MGKWIITLFLVYQLLKLQHMHYLHIHTRIHTLRAEAMLTLCHSSSSTGSFVTGPKFH